MKSMERKKSPPQGWARALFPMRIAGSHNYSRSAPAFQLNEDLPGVECDKVTTRLIA